MKRARHTAAWKPNGIDWTTARADYVGERGVSVGGVFFAVGEEAIAKQMRAMGLPIWQQISYLADCVQALSCHSVEASSVAHGMLERLCHVGERQEGAMRRAKALADGVASLSCTAVAQPQPAVAGNGAVQAANEPPMAQANDVAAEKQGFVESFTLMVPDDDRIEVHSLFDNLKRYHLLCPTCTVDQLLAVLGFKVKLPQSVVQWAGYEYELRLFISTLVKNKIIKARGGETWRVAATLFEPSGGKMQRPFSARGLCSARPKSQATESKVLECIPAKWRKLNDRA